MLGSGKMWPRIPGNNFASVGWKAGSGPGVFAGAGRCVEGCLGLRVQGLLQNLGG